MSLPSTAPTPERTTAEKVRDALADIKAEYQDPSHDHPWIVGYSGGKDSTLVLQLVIEVLLQLSPSERRRPVHVLANDTLVESPVLAGHLERMLGKTKTAADKQGGRKVVKPSGSPLKAPDALFGRATIAEGRLKFFPMTALYNSALIYKHDRRVNELHLTLEDLSNYSLSEG